MSGKRDEDSDMEVGMTTAERRRRRRRGAGLRVPRDNVPRSRTDPMARVEKTVDVDVDVDDVTAQRAPIEPIHKRTTAPMPTATPNRLQTVALSEDDLEELRPQTQPGAAKKSSRSSDANKTI